MTKELIPREIKIDLFNISGRKVTSIINGYYLPGYHKVESNMIPPGKILLRMISKDFTSIITVINN